MAGWRGLTSATPSRRPAMTGVPGKLYVATAKEVLKGRPDGLREVVRAVLHEVLEAEMTGALGAARGERTAARLGYRSGHYGRTLVTRVGKPELRVPRDRDGRFSTGLFERYRRSGQALVASLAEMRACPPAGGAGPGGPGRLDAEGEGGHGGAVRARLLRLGDLLDQQAPRRGARRLRPAAARGAVRLPDARRPLREGARERHRGQPGGAGRGRDRPGGTAPGARGRAGEPGEPLVVEGLPARGRPNIHATSRKVAPGMLSQSDPLGSAPPEAAAL